MSAFENGTDQIVPSLRQHDTQWGSWVPIPVVYSTHWQGGMAYEKPAVTSSKRESDSSDDSANEGGKRISVGRCVGMEP